MFRDDDQPADGAEGVRTDRIAARLGLTKGSFHHHFAGIDDYRQSVLERHEHDQRAVLEQLSSSLEKIPADQAIAALPERLAELFDAELERAVRSWAFTDPAARAVQERLDGARLAFLRTLWTRILGDGQRAEVAALVPHLIAIGASMAQPRLASGDLRKVFDLLSALAPGVGRLGQPPPEGLASNGP